MYSNSPLVIRLRVFLIVRTDDYGNSKIQQETADVEKSFQLFEQLERFLNNVLVFIFSQHTGMEFFWTVFNMVTPLTGITSWELRVVAIFLYFVGNKDVRKITSHHRHHLRHLMRVHYQALFCLPPMLRHLSKDPEKDSAGTSSSEPAVLHMPPSEVFTLPLWFLQESGHSGGIQCVPEEWFLAEGPAKIEIPVAYYSWGIESFRFWDRNAPLECTGMDSGGMQIQPLLN